ncbi:MAG: sigma-70 family RNA polymerase sigma factor [Candidatus Omnitrophota bacterium]
MGDLEFIQRCVKGDSQPWDEFLKKYSRLIFNYIYNTLNAKGFIPSQEHTEDIFQGVFQSLLDNNYRKLKSFGGRNGCSLASWLRQVTINFTIDYLRKVKPAVSMDAQDNEGLALKDILPDDSNPIPDTLIHAEKLNTLKECIEKLEKQDKYFLELHINRGLRLETLKEHFRVSRGAIDMQKSRIIGRLRDCFKTKGFALDL